MVEQARPVLLFDGVCNLCHASVRFVLKHDKAGVFNFASQQSAYGQEVLKRHGLPEGASVYLLDEQGVYAKSDAVLRVLYLLGYPWRVFNVYSALPKALRDGAYDFVGKRRYAWFGRMDACPTPNPAYKDRFLG